MCEMSQKRKKKVLYSMSVILLLPCSDSIATCAHIFEWKTFPVAQCSGWIYYEIFKCH